MPGDLVYRILNNIEVAPSGCFNWKLFRNKKGYGRMKVDGQHRPAHRVSYQVFRKAVPEGLFVLHECDNPACVNPAHLFLGTNLDNVRDSVAKGRNSRGERHGRSKLSDANIQEVTKRYSGGESIKNLSLAFNVTVRTMNEVLRGKSFKHIKRRCFSLPGNPSGSGNTNAKLDEESVIKIRRAAALGRSRKSIASEFGISASNVGAIVLRKAWRHL